MANLIDAVEIAGAAVYGVRQVSYTVGGAAGKDYGAALTAAVFRESSAIEATMNSYATVVRQRTRKLDDLGVLMANINYAIGNLKTKDTESSDKAALANGTQAITIARRYGISGITTTMTRANLYKKQNEVQYAMDREDNDLKQDMVALNSLMSKRDNAFSNAARIIKKVNNAASNTISNIGM